MSYKWLTGSKRKRKYIFSKFKGLRWDFRIKRACGLLFNGGPCSEIVLFPFTIPGFFSKNILWGPNGSQHSVFGWWACTFPNPTLLLKKKYRKYIAINRNGGVPQCSNPWTLACHCLLFLGWKQNNQNPRKEKRPRKLLRDSFPTLIPGLHCIFVCHFGIFVHNNKGFQKCNNAAKHVFLRPNITFSFSFGEAPYTSASIPSHWCPSVCLTSPACFRRHATSACPCCPYFCTVFLSLFLCLF